MEHRKRNRMQHKVELSLVLKTLMAGRRNRKCRTLIDSDGRLYKEFSAVKGKPVAGNVKEFDIFY